MIQSMTGYGKNTIHINGKLVICEIKTLNSKQLDINTRIASLYREKENVIRAMITRELQRGKIELSLYIEKSDKNSISINYDLAKEYYNKFNELSKSVNNPIESDIFSLILKMPDVISTGKEELTNEEWMSIEETVADCCKKVVEFRKNEGEVLMNDFKKRIGLIYNMIAEITPFENNRITTLRSKFDSALSEIATSCNYDKNRLEQEIIFYLEKLDITEEKVRLAKHCNYFIETMNNEESNGKKLGFIVQEIGREVNTLGSKCNDFNIQQIVVRMKDEVEKLKEQLANIL